MRLRGYRHERPHRPSRLPRRLVPPPERPGFNIAWLIYVGILLAALMVVLAIPYLVMYIVNLISS